MSAETLKTRILVTSWSFSHFLTRITSNLPNCKNINYISLFETYQIHSTIGWFFIQPQKRISHKIQYYHHNYYFLCINLYYTKKSVDLDTGNHIQPRQISSSQVVKMNTFIKFTGSNVFVIHNRPKHNKTFSTATQYQRFE